MQLRTGSCPAAGLVGCCLIATPMAALTTTNAACYHDAAQASNGQAACTGANHSWQAAAP